MPSSCGQGNNKTPRTKHGWLAPCSQACTEEADASNNTMPYPHTVHSTSPATEAAMTISSVVTSKPRIVAAAAPLLVLLLLLELRLEAPPSAVPNSGRKVRSIVCKATPCFTAPAPFPCGSTFAPSQSACLCCSIGAALLSLRPLSLLTAAVAAAPMLQLGLLNNSTSAPTAVTMT